MSDQIPEATNNTGDSDYNSSISETTTAFESGAENSGTQESGQTNGNPAWDSLLSAVPQEFHNHLKSGLGEWDKGVQNRFQKVQQEYAPLKQYKEFADLNVAPDVINEAMQFQHALRTNPQAVYEWMQEQYKFGQQTSQGQEDNSEEYELSETDAFFNDPRYKAVQAKADFAEQAIKQFNQQAVTNKVNAQLETETKAVQEQFPGLNIADVATYALGMSKNDNSTPDLIKAAQAMSKFIPNAAPPVERVSDSAPPVISGNRGLPSNTTKFGDMTSDERSKFVADYMKAASQE
jgi:hypothetical protein